MLKLTKEQKANKIQNVGEIMGMLVSAKMRGEKVTVLNIPLRLLSIDTAYQTPERSERDKSKLIQNWDEHQLLPIVVVPHYEEGVFAIVDGTARYVVKLILNGGDMNQTIMCLVLLDAPKNPRERQKFEARIFTEQNKITTLVKPSHKHGAYLILGDKATKEIEKAIRKYGYRYTSGKGKRKSGVVGSYSSMLEAANKGGFKALDFVFAVLHESRFDEKASGLSSAVMRALTDMYVLYGNRYHKNQRFFGKLLRNTTPKVLSANAVSKYPYQDKRMAISLYLEDALTGSIKVSRKRKEDSESRKIIIIDVTES